MSSTSEALLTEKNILVTGGAGFIGSEVVRMLSRGPGNRVVVVDDFSIGLQENIVRRTNVIVKRMNITSAKFRDALQTCDIVFHLAAKTYVPHSYTSPREYFEVNASGTLHLLNLLTKTRIEKLVFVSSSEVYGTARYVPIDEDHPTFPQSTYAASKLAGERLAFTMHKEHGFPLVILRPFNTYGPRDSHPRIIPEIIAQFLSGNTLHLGDIESSRDFTFVEDTARGIIQAAASPRTVGETINLGTGVETKVRDLVALVAKLRGDVGYRVVSEKKRLRPYDVHQLVAGIKRARALFGWQPRVGLEEGLGQTLEWYRRHRRWRWERKDYPGK